MTEREIVDLWKQANLLGEEVYLATVVFVEGSSYRKPGARMLVAASGRRAGTISGGCLEAEVAKKIGWLTSEGPTIQEYRSSFDDEMEGAAHGLGCGGTIWILMEAGDRAAATLRAIEASLVHRKSFAVMASLRGPELGTRVTLPLDSEGEGIDEASGLPEEILEAAKLVGTTRHPCHLGMDDSVALPSLIVLPILPPLRLHVFGAGDDAVPLVRLAVELGWEAMVWDGRSHLLRQPRFPTASLHLIRYHAFGGAEEHHDLQVVDDLPEVAATDFAVILTHSYAQDGALLQALIPKNLRYLGILGPLHRTRRLLMDKVHVPGQTVEEILEKLYAPVGLEIGSYDPNTIALSITFEIQAVLAKKQISVSAMPD